MATLRDIKRRINAVASTAKITQAMRMISAAQLRRAQDNVLSARPYVEKLSDILSNLIKSAGEDYYHPLIQKPKKLNSIAIIAIASDRGLCGSFNTNLFRLTHRYIREDILSFNPHAQISVIPVGRRACQVLRKENVIIPKEYPGVFHKLNFNIAKDIAAVASEGFINNEFDQVLIFYNYFKNLISQVPSTLQLLPIQPKKAEVNHEKYKLDYIFEPDQSSILDELLPTHINIQVWRTLLESYAAEQAARMMAMENATNNANELIKYLELVYNKERQASITKEMLEIVGGAEALKKG
jgi:F-type H+-transporting ATPase subunit gamma